MEDLEEYEQIGISSTDLGIAPETKVYTAKEALDLFDATWYNRTSQLSRWMDIIGDYAGEELFLLDGDSLLGLVLDDPLLALGRDNDNSFQFLHARYNLEHVLHEFMKRNAVFEVVFWEDHRHMTYRTGSSGFVTASRTLARSVLRCSISELLIPLHTFRDLNDPEWIQFSIQRKPMFVMTDDGGPVENDDKAGELRASRALTQRLFIFDILASGIAVALMLGAEFKDSKIFSFIYEQRRKPNARDLLDAQFWTASTCAGVTLDDKLSPVGTRVVAADRTDWLLHSARYFFTLSNPTDAFACPVLCVFLAHALVLETIPMELRAQPIPALHPDLEAYLQGQFLPRIFRCLERSLPDTPTFRDIDLDGRVFLCLLQTFVSTSPVREDLPTLLGPGPASAVVAIWNALEIKTDFSGLSRFGAFKTPERPSSSENTSLSVLPFSHPMLDKHLAPVDVRVDASSSLLDRGNFDFGTGLGTLFTDNRHWHSNKAILPKHLGGKDEKQSALDPKAYRRALRRTQHFMNGLQKQAQTLTGALGMPLKTIVIPPVGNKSQAKPIKKAPQHAAHGSSRKGGTPKLTSTERTRLRIEEEKQAKKDLEDVEWWSKKYLGLRQLDSLVAQIQETDSLLRNRRTAQGWLAVEVRLYRLHLEILDWIRHERSDAEDSDITDRYRVRILNMVKDQAGQATPTAASILRCVLSALGFSDIAPTLLAGTRSVPDRPLSFEFVKVTKKSGSAVYKFMKLDEHPTHWLLRCFGEHMDRSLDSKPDSRVPFEPDGWQRQVLDSLDADASVLVVAPTSAGKTFISYYAMEQVLRSSDDGILIYVAPTKALVTQIAAEVSARFKKDIDGRSCWAVHTRDYRIHDPQKCQVLITVPQVLAIMLLSPTLARVWTPRIKRIILDEIHSIGQEDGGSIWEQILLLAPCPIIGLSATVGAPEKFNGWLSSVQTAHHFKHVFIQHPHRYSHLRKFFYMPSPQMAFTGLARDKRSNRLRFLHPVSLLASGMARVIPPDFSLEARDCISLFNALKQQDGMKVKDIEALDPANFFGNVFLKQEDVLRYEQALKTVLAGLIEERHSHEPTSRLQAVVRRLSDPVIVAAQDDLLTTAPRSSVLENDLIHLVSDLHAEGDLPALVFSFDRHQCETLARGLLKRLIDAEELWRETSPEWRRKIQAWERYQSKAKERDRVNERSQRQRPNDDQVGSFAAPEDLSWEASFDPSDPSPQFSCAGVKTSYDKSELDSDLQGLGWTSTPEWALQAIKRGIAVHHSGMNRKYRNLVEALFRVGFLQVVIATGTLALGINAPCRTVIFCGDSTFLTALQYRQAAGRAGRRGFDLLGKVVFYGLPLDRVQRLVLSRLPPIAGQFPLSTTLCLRLFNLLAGSQNAPYAINAVSAILALPQISIGSETGQHELLHHLRFSIDYLLRAHLVSADGQPLNLTGLASHLYYHEPNNLAFVALLRGGVIHKICNQASMVKAKHELMLVLCHLFGRRRLPRSALNEHSLRPLIKRYPSMIVLPPLPRAAREVLAHHGALTLRVFTGYACTYASQYAHQLGRDNVLPLSGVGITPMDVDCGFAHRLRSSSSTFVARSAFVANSGHTDSFTDVVELCREARRGLHLNENAIPSMDAILADDRSPFKLNAYLLDFYKHGQVEALARANGIRKGDVWFLLQDFNLSLMTIQSSIQELLIKASKEDVVAEDAEDTEEASGHLLAEFGSDPDPDDEEHVGDDGFRRPPGVGDADWRVYEVISDICSEFDAKFRAMWA